VEQDRIYPVGLVVAFVASNPADKLIDLVYALKSQFRRMRGS